MGIADKLLKFVAENIAAGSTLVPANVREARKDICYGRNGYERCDDLIFKDEYSECGLCGCYIEVKTAHDTHILEGLKNGKIKREKVECPIGKWAAYFKELEKLN